jgi:hypothetical protein
MKIEMVKHHGGLLSPANDIEQEKLSRFKTGELYTVEIKQTRNPAFHRKVFAFFGFCFEYWVSDRENLSAAKQFDVFRQHLTVLAGFYDTFYGIDGRVRVEAKSLSYGSMSQSEFEECYHALINAAMKNVFCGDDRETYEKLCRFF